ncbi:putative adenylyl-sulfate kinase [bacterium BMS3Bbin08]|nr:putative adenylyl-sulfate kinase [bacterium BMS3Bbin08]
MKNCPYYECYIKCPLEVCEQRDPKGIYKRARAGEIANMTGISAPYEEPQNPDLIIETDKLSLELSVDLMIHFLMEKGIMPDLLMSE